MGTKSRKIRQWPAPSFGAALPCRPLRASGQLVRQLAPMSQTTPDHACPTNKICGLRTYDPNAQLHNSKLRALGQCSKKSPDGKVLRTTAKAKFWHGYHRNFGTGPRNQLELRKHIACASERYSRELLKKRRTTRNREICRNTRGKNGELNACPDADTYQGSWYVHSTLQCNFF